MKFCDWVELRVLLLLLYGVLRTPCSRRVPCVLDVSPAGWHQSVVAGLVFDSDRISTHANLVLSVFDPEIYRSIFCDFLGTFN